MKLINVAHQQIKNGDYVVSFSSSIFLKKTTSPLDLEQFLLNGNAIIRYVKNDTLTFLGSKRNIKISSFFGYTRYNMERWIYQEITLASNMYILVANEAEMTELKLRNILM